MDRGCDGALERWVRERDPNLIVVCGMVELLRANIYTVPALGAINVHPSALPKYRGPNPTFWMYHDMDLEGGVTIHFIDDGADTGDILLQETFPIPLGMPLREMIGRTMGEIAPRLVLAAIADLAAGGTRRLPQPAASPTVRARRLAPGEARRLIDWEGWPIERVWHVLRGTGPWLGPLDPPPGRSRRSPGWIVGDYVRTPAYGGVPGAVARDADGYFVVHREGKVRLSIGPPRRIGRFGALRRALGLRGAS
jgi:hypothetical protein